MDICVFFRGTSLYPQNVEVKRDAVSGLASLAATEENKEIMGRMGALTALIELVFQGALRSPVFLVRVARAIPPGACGKRVFHLPRTIEPRKRCTTVVSSALRAFGKCWLRQRNPNHP